MTLIIDFQDIILAYLFCMCLYFTIGMIIDELLPKTTPLTKWMHKHPGIIKCGVLAFLIFYPACLLWCPACLPQSQFWATCTIIAWLAAVTWFSYWIIRLVKKHK